MDSLDWGNELEESLIMAGANMGLIYNNHKNNFEQTKLDTYTNHQSQLQIQKTETTLPNFLPQWNSRSGSGSGSSWGVAVNAGTSRSCIDYGRPCALNTIPPPSSSFMNVLDSNSSVVDHQPRLKNMKQQAPSMATKTASFESSLDCLLSASTDTTTTSADQDDGISLIFSDHRNTLWNFAASSNTVPSPSPPPSNINNTVVTRSSKESVINNQSASSLNNGSKRRRYATTTDQPPPPVGLSKQTNLDFRSAGGGGSENREKPGKKAILMDNKQQAVASSSNINFQQTSSSASSGGEEADAEAIAQMKEIIYRAAAFRPVNFGAEEVERPRRKNVRVSNDPQTVAARQRRERISERIRVLQKLVPGGSKMDTASMLDEAANYLKFLRSQVKALEAFGNKGSIDPTVHNFPANTNLAFSPFINYSFAMQQPQFSIHNPNPSKS